MEHDDIFDIYRILRGNFGDDKIKFFSSIWINKKFLKNLVKFRKV